MTEKETATFTIGNHIMLRCPHCDQQYEARLDNNPLVKDGIQIVSLPIEVPEVSEVEQ